MIARRIVNKLVSLVDAALSRLYNARHPGPVARRIIAAFGPVVRQCQPNDKWNLHVMVPYWLRAVSVPAKRPLPKPKSIFIFCAYRGVFTNHLVLATLLAWRGHKVTIGYLPKLQSPSKPPLQDHPSARPYLHSILDRVAALSGGAIECIDIATDETGFIDRSFVERQARYDTVMAYQKEILDMTDPEVWALHEHMIGIGERAQTAIRRHFKRRRYDLCIVGNGATFEGAHACAISREIGQAVNCTEKFAFRGVRVINHGDHYLAGDDIGYFWDQREVLGYTKAPYLKNFLARAENSIL